MRPIQLLPPDLERIVSDESQTAAIHTCQLPSNASYSPGLSQIVTEAPMGSSCHFGIHGLGRVRPHLDLNTTIPLHQQFIPEPSGRPEFEL